MGTTTDKKQESDAVDFSLGKTPLYKLAARYLEYEPELQYENGAIHIITDLDIDHGRRIPYYAAKASFNGMQPLDHAMLRLRPFPALCEPLPDGTVPAVEVAKLVMQASRPESRTPIANYGVPTLRQPGHIVSVDCHRDTSYTLELLIDATWAACIVYDFGIVNAHNMLAIGDYLRSQHFALPVNGRSLVEGVDYILKP